MNETIILFFHGGSWTGGSAHEADPFRDCFGDRADFRAIDYPLFPRTTLGGMIKYCADAIQKAKKEYKKVIVCGRSAGGQLAVMAARIAKPDGVIAISAPLDFSKVPSMRLLRLLPSWHMWDPIRSAKSDKIPTLLVHGYQDNLVPIAAAEAYAAVKDCFQARLPGTHDISIIRGAAAPIKDFVKYIQEKPS